jgi:predicted NAD/FAD-binding protein
MSFGVSISDGQFEWGSKSISSFVGQLSTLLKPWFWRLVFDVLRFSFFAEEILYEYSTPSTHNLFDKISCQATNGHEDKIFCSRPLESIGDYLNRMGYSKQFIECFLIPMVAAPWCIDPERFARTFPARPLIEFM